MPSKTLLDMKMDIFSFKKFLPVDCRRALCYPNTNMGKVVLEVKISQSFQKNWRANKVEIARKMLLYIDAPFFLWYIYINDVHTSKNGIGIDCEIKMPVVGQEREFITITVKNNIVTTV